MGLLLSLGAAALICGLVSNGGCVRMGLLSTLESPSPGMHLFSFTKSCWFCWENVDGLHYESEQVT